MNQGIPLTCERTVEKRTGKTVKLGRMNWHADSYHIYGKDIQKGAEYIGIIKQEDALTAFYMRGTIAMNKIPQLMQSMGEGDFINPFDFNIEDFGKDTQDK